MWKCIDCGLAIQAEAVKPQVDSDGGYFICPGCGGRNPLVNIGGLGQEDPIVWEQLRQPDI